MVSTYDSGQVIIFGIIKPISVTNPNNVIMTMVITTVSNGDTTSGTITYYDESDTILDTLSGTTDVGSFTKTVTGIIPADTRRIVVVKSGSDGHIQWSPIYVHVSDSVS